MSGTLNSTKYEDDSGDENSEIEQLSSPRSKSDVSNIDYWYGQQYLKDVMAQEVFTSCAPNETVSSVDARFQLLVRTFPYHEAIKSLQTENDFFARTGDLPVDNDGQYRLSTLVGTTIRLGSAEERRQLLTTLQKSAGLRNGSLPKVSGAKPPSPAPLEGRISPPGNLTGIKGGNYTSILKEKADMRGLSPEYSFDRLPHDMDTFRAELKFDGQVFYGVGKKKQEAKHQASKAACGYLASQRERLP